MTNITPRDLIREVKDSSPPRADTDRGGMVGMYFDQGNTLGELEDQMNELAERDSPKKKT